MLGTIMMQEIQALKLQNYTVPEIRERLAKTMDKPPSLPTIRKYFNMDVLPDTPGEKLQKDKAFDAFFQQFIQDKKYNVSTEDKILYARVDKIAQSYQQIIKT